MSEREESTPSKQEKTNKVRCIQVIHINKDSSITELINSINNFDQKLNSLASTEYMDKCLHKLVTEDIAKKMIDGLRDDISKQIKTEIDKVQMRKVKTKLAEQATETLELKNTHSDMQVKMEKLTNDNETLLIRNKDLQEQIRQKSDYLKRHDIELNDIEQYTRHNSIRLYGVNDLDRNELHRNPWI